MTEKFKSYFYEEISVRINHLTDFKDTEWAVAVTDGKCPLEVFRNIRGIEVVLADTYSYIYRSPDGKSSISIMGNKKAGDNALYADMKVKLPGCPEIETIHIVTEEYFNGCDSESGDVPVIFLEDQKTGL